MKVNQFTSLRLDHTQLIPYKEEHVEQYHKWMLDEEIRKLTKSELLTIKEEYEMQKSWQEDKDKLTFIICNAANDKLILIGDVNIFTVPAFEVDNLVDNHYLNTGKYGEIEIMIAEKQYRGQNHGYNAIKMILFYANQVGFDQFIVRIAVDNTQSLNFFKRIGFTKLYSNSVFNEQVLHFSHKVENCNILSFPFE